MNRLKNYFDSTRLAKMELVEARTAAERKDLGRAQIHTARALEYLLTAMNNVASIGFNSKPKRGDR